MTPQKTEMFLRILGCKIPPAQNRAGWFVSSCPLAPWRHDGGVDKNPSFACKLEDGHAFTTCFSCGWHGSQSDLVHEMRHRNKVDPKVTVKWVDVFLMLEDTEFEAELGLDFVGIEERLAAKPPKPHYFPEWWLGTFHSWRQFAWSRDYVQERQVPASVADFLDLRADSAENRVCFPVRDFDKKLVGLHGRALAKNADPRYRMYQHAGTNNPIVWYGEHYVDFNKPIVVVEGPFDVASVYRVYRNVVSPLFANPSAEKLLRMQDCLEWYTVLDRGKGGDFGRSKISKTMTKGHYVKHLYPPDDVKDPGACTVDELADILGEHLELDEKLL